MEEKKNNAVEKVEKITGEIPRDKKELSREDKERDLAEKRIELAKKKLENKNRKEELKLYKKRQKEQRKKEKQEKKGDNKNGGWLVAVITLSVATLVLASSLTFTLLMPTESDTALESTYQKSFYDTVEQVDNIDLNLSKILASKDERAIQGYLLDVAVNSELCENDLQQLPLEDQNKFYTTKLVNQIGDFAKQMNKKLLFGKSLTEEDLSIFVSLYEANKSFKQALAKMTEKMGNDFSFSALADGNDGNVVISGLSELQNMSASYPELIYDGPFSDGINQREIKGLSGSEISDSDAEMRFSEIFGGYGVQNIMAIGFTDTQISCINVTAQRDGEEMFAQFSKQGGKLIMFDMSGSCNGVNIESVKAQEIASEFLENQGVGKMKAVWTNLANNVYTFNFALDEDGVIVYPDLIKIRVCAETGLVIGYEASTYYTNHTERDIEKPVLNSEQAKNKVSSNIEIETSRLAVVPIGTKTEKLCYEFCGNYDDSTYYVYIDAVSGNQVEMFKVVEGTEGSLLM